MVMEITMLDIVQARNRIQKHITQTPLLHSKVLSSLTGADVWFKLENLQITGSFKPRGALNKVLSLHENERLKGVITASSGNHAQGVAYAASLCGITALIVVPETTPQTKQEAIKRSGAELVLYGKTYDDAEEFANRLALETGRTFIHAFNDPMIMAGQGTIGLEVLLEQPDFDKILVPVGGGGLLNGIATVAKSINPAIQMIGVQSKASPPWYYSFKERRMVDVEYEESLADGTYGGIHWEPLEYALRVVDDNVLVEEEAIAEAVCWMAQHHHYMIEGSGALGIAALLSEQMEDVKGKKILCVISGGNVEASLLANLITSRASVESFNDEPYSQD